MYATNVTSLSPVLRRRKRLEAMRIYHNAEEPRVFCVGNHVMCKIGTAENALGRIVGNGYNTGLTREFILL